jgi:hypothetical protein
VTSAPEGGGWSAPRPGRFPSGKDPGPIVQEAGLAPGPAWTCAKNRTSTGIRSLDRPVHNQSLYRLRYRYQKGNFINRIKNSNQLSTFSFYGIIACNNFHELIFHCQEEWFMAITVAGEGVRPLACRYCGFESHR